MSAERPGELRPGPRLARWSGSSRNRLCGKDLFAPRGPDYEIVAGQQDVVRGANGGIPMNGMANPTYQGAVNPDQLLISEGRILVATANGSDRRLALPRDGQAADLHATRRPQRREPAVDQQGRTRD